MGWLCLPEQDAQRNCRMLERSLLFSPSNLVSVKTFCSTNSKGHRQACAGGWKLARHAAHEPGAGDRALHEVLERCETPEDGALALKALRTLRRHRAAMQLHSDFTRYTSNLFLDVSSPLSPARTHCARFG